MDLIDLRQEVMERVEEVMQKASQYQDTFNRYSPLWLDDRAEFLRQFLLYGHALTAEEVEAYGEDAFPENPPTTVQFKKQVRTKYQEIKMKEQHVDKGLSDLHSFCLVTV